MDGTDTDNEATCKVLQSAPCTPIADLERDIANPNERVVQGEITITWPFSIVTKSIAFKLVEKDYRLRMNNGQVRVDFHGAAGKAVAKAAIGGGDEVQLSLDGVKWTEAPLPKRPDTVKWQLEFTDRLRMNVKRAEDGEEVTLDVDGPTSEEEDIPLPLPIEVPEAPVPTTETPAPAPASISVEPTPSPLLATPSLPTKRLASTAFEEEEYASPAFLKRSRLSHGGFWEGDLEDFDDANRRKKKKRRSRFSMVQRWTYSSRTPSPEPEAQPELEAEESGNEDEEAESYPVKVSPPMVDEGVQTRIENKVPLPVAQAATSPSARSPELPSSPTPAVISSNRHVEPEEEEHTSDLRVAQEEQRQAAPQPNLFAPTQQFGQSQMAATPHTWGYGSNNTSAFGTSSGFASQAPFGAGPAATFGSNSGFGAPSSSVNAIGGTSGVGFGFGTRAGFGSSVGSVFGSNAGNAAGSAFGAKTGNDVGRGFGEAKGTALESSAPQYSESVVDPQIVSQEEAVPGDEQHKLYQASDFFSAPADHATPQPELPERHVGDFNHDIANDVPAFAPSQLEQASWGTLTSMPPPSQAPESNTLDNPVEILSSSPPRAPSPDEEHDPGELEDQQPETSDVEQEDERPRQQGYMQVEPVAEDTPVDTGESTVQSQIGATDEYEDGGDLAGEDYDLRNYDDAQEDDVVESDDESGRAVDPSDPDQQAVDFEEDESELDEEEELEYAPPGGMEHGVSGETGEFDADGEIDDEYGYGEEYEDEDEDEEGEPMDYDEEEMEDESLGGRTPPPPSSKEPVFIDLLSDSDDDEPPPPAPVAVSEAKPLPTAAARERESEDEDEEREENAPTGSPESEEYMAGAEFGARLEDTKAQGENDDHAQAAEEHEDGDSDVDTPPSKRSSPPPSEDENLGPTNTPFAVPFTASSLKQREKDVGEDESSQPGTVENDLVAAPRQEGQSGLEATEVDMQDRDDKEPFYTVPETQQASGDKNTQSSVTFESQPRNDLSFAASATQQESSQDSLLHPSQTAAIDDAFVNKGLVGAESDAEPGPPETVEVQAEVTEVVAEVREKPAAEVDEVQPDTILEEDRLVETDRALVASEPAKQPDEIMADADEVPIEQASAAPAPETQTQTLRAQETAQAMQPTEQDAAALVGEPSPTPSETQRADQPAQVGEEANDTDSEAEYSFALEQQIMAESQSARGSHPPQAEVPSIEQPESHEKTSRRVTRSRAKDKPDRDILITVESLRSWDAKSMSSRATSAAPEEPQKTERKNDSQATRVTPEPRKRSQSQVSPQSIRVTRSRNYDNDPSLLLVGETPKRKGHKEPSAAARETRSSVAASTEPEERPQSQASTQSIRVTRNRAREDDPSLLLAGYKESQDSHLSSQELVESTPRPRKIRGEVTPEPELGSERSLRSKTPEPAADKATSPSADKEKTAEENSFVEEDETIASLKSKLSKELRSNLAGYVPLSTLKSHIGERKDIMAVVTSTPEPAVKLKAGPRDHLLELLITDAASANSSTSVSVAHLLRPRKDALPTVTAGDVILLRHFSIVAMTGRGYGVRSGEGSAWAVWEKSDTEGHPQIKGPPVELGPAERRYAEGLRKWWELVEGDEKISGKVGRKTQLAIKVGKENKGKGK